MVYFSIFHAIHASILTFMVSLFNDLPFDFFFCLLSFSSVLLVYNKDRRKVDAEDLANQPTRSAWVQKNQIYFTLLMAASIFGILTTFYFRPTSIFFMSILLTISLLYTKKFNFLENRSMKQLPATKNILVPVVWWLTLVGPQCLYYKQSFFSIFNFSSIFIFSWTR